MSELTDEYDRFFQVSSEARAQLREAIASDERVNAALAEIGATALEALKDFTREVAVPAAKQVLTQLLSDAISKHAR